jgi:hypothetical protein
VEPERVNVPSNVPQDKILFMTNAGLVNGIVENMDYVVYVDPKAYDALSSYEEKMEIAATINLLNKRLSNNRYALIGLGRWGSNDINLGVKVTYSDISKAKLLAEVAFAKEGYVPEVSYGTHFFQDLVEADIMVVPIFPETPGAILNESFLLNSENSLSALFPDMRRREKVIKVIHVPSICDDEFLHVYLDSSVQAGMGYFGPKREIKEMKS